MRGVLRFYLEVWYSRESVLPRRNCYFPKRKMARTRIKRHKELEEDDYSTSDDLEPRIVENSVRSDKNYFCGREKNIETENEECNKVEKYSNNDPTSSSSVLPSPPCNIGDNKLSLPMQQCHNKKEGVALHKDGSQDVSCDSLEPSPVSYNILEGVCNRIEQNNHEMTDLEMEILYRLFPESFVKAVKIIDKGEVEKVMIGDTGRHYYYVKGSKNWYTIYAHVNFCECQMFKVYMLEKHQHYVCKHVLATRVAAAMGKIRERTSTSFGSPMV